MTSFDKVDDSDICVHPSFSAPEVMRSCELDRRHHRFSPRSCCVQGGTKVTLNQTEEQSPGAMAGWVWALSRRLREINVLPSRNRGDDSLSEKKEKEKKKTHTPKNRLN